MILIVGANSAWQKIAFLPSLHPGEVNRVTKVVEVAAGKGANVLRALGGLGPGEALLLGYAGGRNGLRFRRCLEAEGLAARLQPIADETRICTTLIAPGGAATEIIEPSPRITESESERFGGLFDEALPAAGLLVIAGSAPQGEAEDSYARFIRAARQQGLPVLLDAAGGMGRSGLEAGPEILKVNLQELEGLTGGRLTARGARLAACRELQRRHGLSWIVVSRGPLGLEGYDGRTFWQAVPPAIAALNPIGAGDTATAGLVRARLAGAGLAEALAEAAALATAGCLTEVPGHVEPGRAEELRRRTRLRRL